MECREPVKPGDLLEIATANADPMKPDGHGPFGGICKIQSGDKVRVKEVVESSRLVVQLPPKRGCPLFGSIDIAATWNKKAVTPGKPATTTPQTAEGAK